MSKILIAEDNPVNRELLRDELLEMRGHTVVEACDGEEALAARRSQVTTRMLFGLKCARRMNVKNKSMHEFATYFQFRAV